MTPNIHEEIGWFTCANLRCKRELGRDHVTLITTAHMRRFCSVLCITEGQAAWQDSLYQRFEQEMRTRAAATEDAAAAKAMIARIFVDHPDWYHRGPCCNCRRCGANGCHVWNPDGQTPEDRPLEIHICEGCGQPITEES